jgi:hypothetical protein
MWHAACEEWGMGYAIQHRRDNPSFSLPSILAIVAAIASFFVGAFLQILLAIAAIILGAIGVFISISPAKRGGIMSVLSIVIGVLAIIIAIVRGVLGIVF